MAISETGDPLTFSIAIISNCPPSKIGIGKRFNSPRLILNNATIDKKVTYPALAADPASTEICIGPQVTNYRKRQYETRSPLIKLHGWMDQIIRVV